MNNISYLFILLLFYSLTASSNNLETITPDSDIHLPTSVKGVHIVPDSELTMSTKMRKIEARQLEEFKKNGYVYSESNSPKFLLNTKYDAIYEINKYKNNDDPHEAHLKSNINEIKLAFPFAGLIFIKPENVIGYVAAGGYVNGWTGVKEFFTDDRVGTCSLTLFNISLTNGGARLGKSKISYKINNKPTTISVDGSINSGFLYAVAWYDNTFVHLLECANMKFDEEITKQMVVLANRIDKAL